MSDDVKQFFIFFAFLLAAILTIALFWRSGNIRDHHIELEKIRIERDRLTSTCPGWCSDGRGFPTRVRGKCECVQVSDWYRGPE